jgi:hypothetical protein
MIPFQIGAKFKVMEGSTKLGIPRHVTGYIDDIRPLGEEHSYQVAVHLRFTRGNVKARRLFAVHLNRLDDNFVKLNAGGGATNGSIRIQLIQRALGETTDVMPNVRRMTLKQRMVAMGDAQGPATRGMHGTPRLKTARELSSIGDDPDMLVWLRALRRKSRRRTSRRR